MSWVAEKKATSTAAAAVNHGVLAGSLHASSTTDTRMPTCASSIQLAPPAEPAVEHRQRQLVDQRRPGELEGVGRADQGEHADGREIDADPAHPVGQRRAGQQERHAAGEAHQQDDELPAVAIDLGRLEPAAPGRSATDWAEAQIRSAQRLLGPRADVGDDLGGGDAAQPRAFGERLAVRKAEQETRGVEIAGAGRVDDLGHGRGGHRVGFAALDHDRALLAAGEGRDLGFLARRLERLPRRTRPRRAM